MLEPTLARLIAPPHPGQQRLLAYWALFHYLPNNAAILVVDVPSGVVEALARERGLPVCRLPSRSLVERHGLWADPALFAMTQGRSPGSDSLPVFVAPRRGIREYLPPVQAGLRWTPPAPVRVRQRELSEVLSEAVDVALVHLGDHAHFCALTVDAVNAARERGISFSLTLPGQPSPQQREILRRLASLYRLYDERFMPVENHDVRGIVFALSEPLAERASACALAVGRGIVDGLRTGRRCDTTVDWVGSSGSEVVTSVARRLLNTTGVRSAILSSALLDGRLAFGHATLGASSFYPVERNGDDCWRWSGPESEARMLIPVPAPGAYVLELEVRHFAAQAPVFASLFVNGVCKQRALHLAAGQLVKLDFEIPADGCPAAANVLIAINRTAQPNPDDPRVLGLSIGRINLYWGRGA